jgi:hypothetical protein
MSQLAGRIARTDRHIRELTERIELYRNRVARRSKNPALAAQADQLLPAICAKRRELVRYRKALQHALELEDYLSTEDRPRPIPPPRGNARRTFDRLAGTSSTGKR